VRDKRLTRVAARARSVHSSVEGSTNKSVNSDTIVPQTAGQATAVDVGVLDAVAEVPTVTVTTETTGVVVAETGMTVVQVCSAH
jgi:hypothetical protein